MKASTGLKVLPACKLTFLAIGWALMLGGCAQRPAQFGELFKIDSAVEVEKILLKTVSEDCELYLSAHKGEFFFYGHARNVRQKIARVCPLYNEVDIPLMGKLFNSTLTLASGQQQGKSYLKIDFKLYAEVVRDWHFAFRKSPIWKQYNQLPKKQKSQWGRDDIVKDVLRSQQSAILKQFNPFLQSIGHQVEKIDYKKIKFVEARKLPFYKDVLKRAKIGKSTKIPIPFATKLHIKKIPRK